MHLGFHTQSLGAFRARLSCPKRHPPPPHAPPPHTPPPHTPPPHLDDVEEVAVGHLHAVGQVGIDGAAPPRAANGLQRRQLHLAEREARVHHLVHTQHGHAHSLRRLGGRRAGERWAKKGFQA